MMPGLFSAAGGAVGAGLGFLGGLLAGKPTLPPFEGINLNTEQQKAIGANLAALPGLEMLGGDVNEFNIAQTKKMLEAAAPGWGAMQTKIGGDITSELSGELPKDVQEAIQRNAAARSLGMGVEGSGMARDLVARDFGFTELNLIDKGITSAESWARTSAALFQPGQFNFSSMFVTPGMEFAAAEKERNAKLSYDLGKSMIDWETSPSYLGGQALTQFGASLSGMGMGFMPRGGGGGGGSAGPKAEDLKVL
jgi:hypothetical protein